MRRHGDLGQTTTSYLGLLVLAGAIVAAVLAVGLPGTLGGSLERAVCTVVQRTACRAADGEVVEPIPVVDPLEQATSGAYVAIGDSFSSGEGAYDYESGSDSDDNQCHRSANAYSRELGDLDFAGGTEFVACSGAKTRNVLRKGQNGEPPQIEAIDGDTSLVTIGIGGNDADWVPVIGECWKQDERGCGGAALDARERIEVAADRVFEVYEEARERAPEGARVVGVGYPRIFPVEPEDDQYKLRVLTETWALTTQEQVFLNGLVRRFNDALAERAAAADVEFVDLYDAYEGHEFGTDDSYFNGYQPQMPELSTSWKDTAASAVASETAHPTAEGQQAMAEAIRRQIEDPEQDS